MARRLWMLAAVAALLAATPASTASSRHDPEQLRCLALNIYWEARSETQPDQAAIAHTTLNRVESPDFPDTICEVVRQGGEDGTCQFSWWCDGEPDEPQNAEAWSEAMRVARAVLNGELPDLTNGAVYFHNEAVEPDWASEMTQTAVVGPHVFYRAE